MTGETVVNWEKVLPKLNVVASMQHYIMHLSMLSAACIMPIKWFLVYFEMKVSEKKPVQNPEGNYSYTVCGNRQLYDVNKVFKNKKKL